MEKDKENAKEYIHIGKNIARFRRFRDMKQEALAKAIGITQQALSDYEKKEVINYNVLVKIASALNVSIRILQTTTESSFDTMIDNTIFPGNIYNLIKEIIRISEEKDRRNEKRISSLEERVEKLESYMKTKRQ